MGNKVPKKQSTTRVSPTGLFSLMVESLHTKCSFKANGHTNCSKELKDFEFVRAIHTDAFCQVYEVEDTVTNEHFALKRYIKTVHEDYQNNEIRNLTYLHDIEGDFVRCEHFFTTKKHNMFVLELLICDIKGFLDGRDCKLSLKTARVVVKKLAKMMIILHRNGIIYADIKQENIMIDESGNLKLISFDQSYKIDEVYPKRLLIGGNFSHMAPETANEKICLSSDWYGVGSFTWELLSAGTPNETLAPEIDSDSVLALKKLSEMKEDIILKAITNDQKAALPFVEKCIRVKVEDRINLDNSGEDFEKVEFLKDVTAEDEEELRKEMLEYVKYVMDSRKNFLKLY